MFKLQLNILQDIISNVSSIDDYKKLDDKLIEDEKNSRITKEEYKEERQHINSEVFSLKLLNKALREIIDGVVWKYLNYNRALLYMLADKPPIETIRPDEGLINNLYEFSDAFLEHGVVAIYNDITNFLRIGDVTQIKENGSIELIEVKAREKRGRRITRQKQRMSELVEFFNTGLKNYDGKKLAIIESDVRQRTYLSQLHESIQKARRHGRESLLIGKYLILEVIDFKKPSSIDELKTFFDSKHESVKEEWKRNGDFVNYSIYADKMDYSKNCAPFAIYPFDIEACTDIMMGRLMMGVWFNFSEILRILTKSKWEVTDCILFKSESELESLRGKEVDSVPFLVIRRGPCIVHVPPSLIARLQYELLAPSAVIAEFEDMYERRPQMAHEYYLTNYIDEKRIWQ